MKRKVLKAVAIILMLCVFAVVVNAVIGGWVSHDMNRYRNLTMTNDVLPKLEELGEYEDIEFKFYRNNMLFFRSDAYILKVSYDEDDYQEQKENLRKQYIYQTEDVSDSGIGITYLIEPSFEIDTFQMKMLSNQEYDMIYPKELIFIGASDEKKMISYVYYFDDDLDYIGSSFEIFLKRECGW